MNFQVYIGYAYNIKYKKAPPKWKNYIPVVIHSHTHKVYETENWTECSEENRIPSIKTIRELQKII